VTAQHLIYMRTGRLYKN